MMQHTHYQHSGKAPFGGILMTLIGGLIAGAILGAIYGFLVYWSPFVYINAFITFGFGLILAVATGGLAKAGKIRNNTVVMVIALIVALFAYYVHWVVWFERVTESLILTPGVLAGFLATIAETGAWTIFDWTPTGFALYAIWGIEALVIVGMGTVSAIGIIDVPFCEDTNQWTEEETLAEHFMPLDGTASVSTPQSVLESLRPMTETGPAFTEVTVATAEGSNLRCVTLQSVTVEIDKDGKEDTKKTELVKNLLFDRDSFERLMNLSQPAMA